MPSLRDHKNLTLNLKVRCACKVVDQGAQEPARRASMTECRRYPADYRHTSKNCSSRIDHTRP